MSQSPHAAAAPVNPQDARDNRSALVRFTQLPSVQGLAGATSQVAATYHFTQQKKHDIQNLWNTNAPAALKAQTAPAQPLYEENFLPWAQRVYNTAIRIDKGVPTCGPLGGWNPQNGGLPVTHLYLCEVTSAHVILAIASFRRTGLDITEQRQGSFLKHACSFFVAEAKRQGAWTPDETPGPQDVARYKEVCEHNEVLLKEWLRITWYRVTGNQARYSSIAYRKSQERLAVATTPGTARKKNRTERTAATNPTAEQAGALARQAGGSGVALHNAGFHTPRGSAQRHRSALHQEVNVDGMLGLAGDDDDDDDVEYAEEEEEEAEVVDEEDDGDVDEEEDAVEEEEEEDSSSSDEVMTLVPPPRGRGRGAAAGASPRGGRGPPAVVASRGRGGGLPQPPAPAAVAKKIPGRGGAAARLGRTGPRGRG